MLNILGYARFTKGSYAIWIDSLNESKNYNSQNKTRSYTRPIPHHSATYDFDDDGAIIVSSIGGEETDVFCLIDSDCPEEFIPETLMTKEEFSNLGWATSTI